jgi:hypothetical protein
MVGILHPPSGGRTRLIRCRKEIIANWQIRMAAARDFAKARSAWSDSASIPKPMLARTNKKSAKPRILIVTPEIT